MYLVLVASEELKNRLAQVARGALMQGKEEEKTKKDERKKKVAMFKALLKSSSSANMSPKSSDGLPSKPCQSLKSLHQPTHLKVL